MVSRLDSQGATLADLQNPARRVFTCFDQDLQKSASIQRERVFCSFQKSFKYSWGPWMAVLGSVTSGAIVAQASSGCRAGSQRPSRRRVGAWRRPSRVRRKRDGSGLQQSSTASLRAKWSAPPSGAGLSWI